MGAVKSALSFVYSCRQVPQTSLIRSSERVGSKLVLYRLEGSVFPNPQLASYGTNPESQQDAEGSSHHRA